MNDVRQAYEDARAAAAAHLDTAMDAVAEAARQGQPKPTHYLEEQVRLNDRVTAAHAAMQEAIRSDLVTARQTIRRAASGDDADLETAAGLIDAALQGLCPHDPAGHYTAYTDAGEELTTCTACHVSWFTGRRYGEGQS